MSTEIDRCTLIFQECGLTRIEGRILYVLSKSGIYLSARDIERFADMRQPEISKGTQGLLKRHWIVEKLNIAVGIGRPQKVYSIRAKERIYDDLYHVCCIKHMQLRENMKELKELLQVKNGKN